MKNKNKETEIYVNEKTAQRIELFDGNGETGGISYIGETLYDFVASIRDSKTLGQFIKEGVCDNIMFTIPLSLINNTLKECGIQPITKTRIKKAQTFTEDDMFSHEQSLVWAVGSILDQIVTDGETYTELMREFKESLMYKENF